jgi:GDP-L-fucose synthase
VLRTHAELDLCNQAAVDQFFKNEKIEFVFLAAAKVGGIQANSSFQADFLYQNLAIALNVIHAAAENSVEKLLFLGSSCIYPKFATQPIAESSLLTGALEETNEGYAIAKIAGLKLCEKYMTQHGKRFISAMPTNLYGPFDNFHPEYSHVIPGMMRRFHESRVKEAQSVTTWGSGTPKREFLHSDDLAEALVLLMQKYEEPGTINVGTGEDCTITQLAEEMKAVTGSPASIVYDDSKPDGTPRKVLDVSRIHSYGWKAKISLREGLSTTYEWALKNKIFN